MLECAHDQNKRAGWGEINNEIMCWLISNNGQDSVKLYFYSSVKMCQSKCEGNGMLVDVLWLRFCNNSNMIVLFISQIEHGFGYYVTLLVIICFDCGRLTYDDQHSFYNCKHKAGFQTNN